MPIIAVLFPVFASQFPLLVGLIDAVISFPGPLAIGLSRPTLQRPS
jgi:hypothetical protein